MVIALISKTTCALQVPAVVVAQSIGTQPQRITYFFKKTKKKKQQTEEKRTTQTARCQHNWSAAKRGSK